MLGLSLEETYHLNQNMYVATFLIPGADNGALKARRDRIQKQLPQEPLKLETALEKVIEEFRKVDPSALEIIIRTSRGQNWATKS